MSQPGSSSALQKIPDRYDCSRGVTRRYVVRFSRFLLDANRPYRGMPRPVDVSSLVCSFESPKPLALLPHQGHDDYREHDDNGHHHDQLEHRFHATSLTTVWRLDRGHSAVSALISVSSSHDARREAFRGEVRIQGPRLRVCEGFVWGLRHRASGFRKNPSLPDPEV